jgi:hypothetical protein
MEKSKTALAGSTGGVVEKRCQNCGNELNKSFRINKSIKKRTQIGHKPDAKTC